MLKVDKNSIEYLWSIRTAVLNNSYNNSIIEIIFKSVTYYFSDNNDSSSKTPTIEMYAPNTYNGGYDENLSSISAKSETYSNVSPDYNVSTNIKHKT